MYNLEKLAFCIKTEEKTISQYIELKKAWQKVILPDITGEKISQKKLTLWSFSPFSLGNVSFAFLLGLVSLNPFLTILFSSILFGFFIFCKEIYQAFNFSKISYEESSWFDNKIWQKSIFLIKKDKLFSKQKIKKKLSFFYKSLFIFLANSILLSFIFSI